MVELPYLHAKMITLVEGYAATNGTASSLECICIYGVMFKGPGARISQWVMFLVYTGECSRGPKARMNIWGF